MKKRNHKFCRGCPLMKSNYLMSRAIYEMIHFDIMNDSGVESAEDSVAGPPPQPPSAGMKAGHIPSEITRYYQ